jgi:hypothetical protein
MRASSGDGGGARGVGGVDGVDGVGGVGGARDDTPLSRPLRVLPILFNLTCITPKLSRRVPRCFKLVLLKLRNRVGCKFSLLVCKQTLLHQGNWLGLA